MPSAESDSGYGRRIIDLLIFEFHHDCAIVVERIAFCSFSKIEQQNLTTIDSIKASLFVASLKRVSQLQFELIIDKQCATVIIRNIRSGPGGAQLALAALLLALPAAHGARVATLPVHLPRRAHPHGPDRVRATAPLAALDPPAARQAGAIKPTYLLISVVRNG